MKKPIIIINFKTYVKSTGENAIRLAKICEEVAFKTKTDIRICVCSTDINSVSKAVKIPVYSEHIDPEQLGKHTGAIPPEAVKAEGATGTLINHSEDKVPFEEVSKAIIRAKEVGLKSIVCATTPEKAEDAALLKPDFVAVEPPELIGGDISVSSAQPEIISESVKRVKERHDVPLLVGAGVKTKEDVKIALELGADGVLVASGITKAEDPKKALIGLIP